MSLAATNEDRRSHPRHPVTIEVFITPGNDTQHRIKTRINNMSLMGCAIEPVDIPLADGESLTLCFVASRDRCSMSTIIQATVVHKKEDYIGLMFNTMGKDVMVLLRSLLSEAKYF